MMIKKLKKGFAYIFIINKEYHSNPFGDFNVWYNDNFFFLNIVYTAIKFTCANNVGNHFFSMIISLGRYLRTTFENLTIHFPPGKMSLINYIRRCGRHRVHTSIDNWTCTR